MQKISARTLVALARSGGPMSHAADRVAAEIDTPEHVAKMRPEPQQRLRDHNAYLAAFVEPEQPDVSDDT